MDAHRTCLLQAASELHAQAGSSASEAAAQGMIGMNTGAAVFTPGASFTPPAPPQPQEHPAPPPVLSHQVA